MGMLQMLFRSFTGMCPEAACFDFAASLCRFRGFPLLLYDFRFLGDTEQEDFIYQKEESDEA